MSRKAFLIWGLVIINLAVAFTAIIQYLVFSKILDINELGFNLHSMIYNLTIVSFAALLFLRFKSLSWRKTITALNLGSPLFIFFTVIGGSLALVYVMGLEPITGAYDRFFDPIAGWANLDDPKPVTPWTAKQRVGFVLYHVPVMHLTQLGLFALLWFGSLGPRTPSKNRFVQFKKTGFQRKEGPAASSEFTQAALG